MALSLLHLPAAHDASLWCPTQQWVLDFLGVEAKCIVVSRLVQKYVAPERLSALRLQAPALLCFALSCGDCGGTLLFLDRRALASAFEGLSSAVFSANATLPTPSSTTTVPAVLPSGGLRYTKLAFSSQ